MAEIELGNLYDINKQLMEKEPILDPIELNLKLKTLCEDTIDNFSNMLLCHEKRDYTVFFIYETATIKTYIKELSEVLHSRGDVLSVEKQQAGGWEIWIRDFITNENSAYYLFDYSRGIVEVG